MNIGGIDNCANNLQVEARFHGIWSEGRPAGNGRKRYIAQHRVTASYALTRTFSSIKVLRLISE